MTQKAKTEDYLKGGSLVLFVFVIVFYGCDYLASRKALFYKLYFAWENNIPFVPESFVIYYSIFIIPFLIPLFVKNKRQVNSITIKLISAIIISGFFFIFFPTILGYDNQDINPSLVKFNKIVTGNHNLFPSLHVALATIIIEALCKNTSKSNKWILLFFLLALSFSTLFTHQHHLLDVIGGFALAISLINLEKFFMREPTIRS